MRCSSSIFAGEQFRRVVQFQKSCMESANGSTVNAVDIPYVSIPVFLSSHSSGPCSSTTAILRTVSRLVPCSFKHVSAKKFKG